MSDAKRRLLRALGGGESGDPTGQPKPDAGREPLGPEYNEQKAWADYSNDPDIRQYLVNEIGPAVESMSLDELREEISLLRAAGDYGMQLDEARLSGEESKWEEIAKEYAKARATLLRYEEEVANRESADKEPWTPERAIRDLWDDDEVKKRLQDYEENTLPLQDTPEKLDDQIGSYNKQQKGWLTDMQSGQKEYRRSAAIEFVAHERMRERALEKKRTFEDGSKKNLDQVLQEAWDKHKGGDKASSRIDWLEKNVIPRILNLSDAQNQVSKYSAEVKKYRKEAQSQLASSGKVSPLTAEEHAVAQRTLERLQEVEQQKRNEEAARLSSTIPVNSDGRGVLTKFFSTSRKKFMGADWLAVGAGVLGGMAAKGLLGKAIMTKITALGLGRITGGVAVGAVAGSAGAMTVEGLRTWRKSSAYRRAEQHYESNYSLKNHEKYSGLEKIDARDAVAVLLKRKVSLEYHREGAASDPEKDEIKSKIDFIDAEIDRINSSDAIKNMPLMARLSAEAERIKSQGLSEGYSKNFELKSKELRQVEKQLGKETGRRLTARRMIKSGLRGGLIGGAVGGIVGGALALFSGPESTAGVASQSPDQAPVAGADTAAAEAAKVEPTAAGAEKLDFIQGGDIKSAVAIEDGLITSESGLPGGDIEAARTSGATEGVEDMEGLPGGDIETAVYGSPITSESGLPGGDIEAARGSEIKSAEWAEGLPGGDIETARGVDGTLPSAETGPAGEGADTETGIDTEGGAETEPTPETEYLAELQTVQKGEGFWHAVERQYRDWLVNKATDEQLSALGLERDNLPTSYDAKGSSQFESVVDDRVWKILTDNDIVKDGIEKRIAGVGERVVLNTETWQITEMPSQIYEVPLGTHETLASPASAEAQELSSTQGADSSLDTAPAQTDGTSGGTGVEGKTPKGVGGEMVEGKTPKGVGGEMVEGKMPKGGEVFESKVPKAGLESAKLEPTIARASVASEGLLGFLFGTATAGAVAREAMFKRGWKDVTGKSTEDAIISMRELDVDAQNRVLKDFLRSARAINGDDVFTRSEVEDMLDRPSEQRAEVIVSRIYNVLTKQNQVLNVSTRENLVKMADVVAGGREEVDKIRRREDLRREEAVRRIISHNVSGKETLTGV